MKQLSSGTLPFKAAIQCKCPRCHSGEMFRRKSIITGSSAMYEECPVCSFNFEIEPGYFYLARAIRYVLNLAEISAVNLAAYAITHVMHLWLYLLLSFFTIISLAAFNFRYSRILLLYLFTPKAYIGAYLHESK